MKKTETETKVQVPQFDNFHTIVVFDPGLRVTKVCDLDEQLKTNVYQFADYKLSNLIACGVTPSAISTTGKGSISEIDNMTNSMLDFAQNNIVNQNQSENKE